MAWQPRCLPSSLLEARRTSMCPARSRSSMGIKSQSFVTEGHRPPAFSSSASRTKSSKSVIPSSWAAKTAKDLKLRELRSFASLRMTCHAPSRSPRMLWVRDLRCETTMTPGDHRDDVAARGEDLSLLVDAVQDYAIFLLSPTGEIRSWNRGGERIMGYTAAEAIGSHFSRFYTEEDLAAEKPARELRVAADEGRVEDEGWRVRKDGSRFWSNTVITALRDDQGELRGFTKV